ncbi:MAG: hypothetical protein FJ267_14015 [Planctomycetes bacterium]|nr:hypothetical protein [Planctomycetota bacterium]
MELAPDMMITSGCPLLRAELSQLPRLGTVNIHWGIAPQYRGENTLFWPLYFNDSEHLGVTIHQIDDSIDGGPILAQGWPAVSRFETELSATLKVTRLISELLPRVVKEIQQIGRITGKSPQGTGRLYLARRRRWYHDFLFRCRRSLGGSALSPRPAREVRVTGD